MRTIRSGIAGLALLLAMCCLGIVHAQQPREFSLEEAVSYARQNNYDVQKALLAIDVANMQKWEVTASGFPQINLNAQYQKLIDIPTQLIPGEIFGGDPGSTIPVKFGKPHNASYSANVTQLVFSGSYFVGLQASRTFLELSEQAHEVARLDAREAVTQSYFLVLIVEENMKVLKSSLENLRKTHYEISEMQKEGFAEATDVKQLQISINQLENQIKSVAQQEDVAFQMLKIQMGLDIDSPITLTDNLNTFLVQGPADELLRREFEVENYVGFRLAVTRERLADLTLKNEWSTFLPTISAFASAERTAQRDEFNLFDSGERWFPTTVIGLRLNWPIFSGGRKAFSIQRARAELRQTQIDLRQAEQGLLLQYNRALGAFETAYDSFKNSENNKELAKEVYQINLEKYREGLISSLELVQAHNQYLRAEGNYLQAASDLLNNRTRLIKLLEGV